MDFVSYTRRKTEYKNKESLDSYLSRGGSIQTIQKPKHKASDGWPINPSGSQMPGQPEGCYKVPAYGDC